jgi:putative hydrolase of the HAD superfamily
MMSGMTERGSVGPVRAVIFDWGGTLTPWHAIDLAAQWQIFAEYYSRDHSHDAPGAGAELAASMLLAEQEAWRRLALDGTSARLHEVHEAAGVSPDHPAYPGAQAAYEEFWEPHTYIDPQVPVLFTGLRERGLRIGVLSNTLWSRDYHERVFARDAVLELIDGAVYTSEISHVKPHPVAFAAAMEAVGVDDPGACVYVGDRLFEDVHGAQRAGMRAILVPHSELPADQRIHVEVEPDAVVHQLLEVLDHVDGWNAAP